MRNGSAPAATLDGATQRTPSRDGSSVAGAQCAGSFVVLASFMPAADASGPASLCSAAPLLAATRAAVVLAPESPPSLTVLAPAAGLALTAAAPLSVSALLSGGTGQWRASGALGSLSRALAAPFALSASVTSRLPPTLFPGAPDSDPRFVGELIPGSLLRASPSASGAGGGADGGRLPRGGGRHARAPGGRARRAGRGRRRRL